MDRRKFIKTAAFFGFTLASQSFATTDFTDKFSQKYFDKIENFDKNFEDDLFISSSKLPLMKSITKKMEDLMSTVGHGNFSLLGFDDMARLIRSYPKIAPLTKEEIAFCEEIFYFNAQDYGFFGAKPLTNLTEKIKEKELIKVPYTGQYIFRGAPEKLYAKIKKEVGETLTLTSGVRGVAKQFYLFFNKTIESNGNFSLASRCLAPPGYSFHGIGDFDVGKVGLGAKNFTSEFAKTEEYKRLTELGYINIRYYEKNLLGVQFEPWHIKTT